jgi:hypothetical protein
LRKLSGRPHQRQGAVGGGRGLGNLAEGRLGLGVLALLAERDGGLEGRTRLRRLLGLPIIVAAPARHRENHQHRRGDDVGLIALPQLLELFAPDFLVDFLKDIGH